VLAFTIAVLGLFSSLEIIPGVGSFAASMMLVNGSGLPVDDTGSALALWTLVLLDAESKRLRSRQHGPREVRTACDEITS
jgi:hypothetical protein